ncbi:MAG: DUF2793 domain-containing protein [Pseudomonadota bacterium]
MSETVHLGLPYIAAAQAQKHVTHNEALRMLDALVMLTVKRRDLSVPPGTPEEGDRYIVHAPGAGAFAGKDESIAHFADGQWQFYTPRLGWVCYVADELMLVAWNGTSWERAIDVVGGVSVLHNLELLGVGTTADSSNRLAVKSDAALFSHDDVMPGTGDMRIAVNKASAGNDAGFAFQDGFGTRALFGLLADNDVRLKTSPDGLSFHNAMRAFAFCGRLDVRDSARRWRAEWYANVNTTTLNAFGLAATAAGTATAAALSATSLFTQSPRLIYASSASAGSSAGVRGAQLVCWRGDAADRGGFYLLMRFGWQQVQAQGRCFAGLSGSVSVIGNVNPSTLTDIIGVGFDSGQTSLRLLYNDNTGAASAVDLGGDFPSNAAQELYELMLCCEPGSDTIAWRVERLNTGHVASGTIDTDLPASTVFLTPQLWGNNGTTAAAVQIALHGLYLEIASLYGSRGI